MERKRGQLSLYNDRQLLIAASLNGSTNLVQFQLDSGCTYSQISLELAKRLGLKSHRRIIGRSGLGDGREKYDYLCETSLTLSGVEKSIVVKVSANQPCLLGLDVMFYFDMEIYIAQQEYSISLNPNYEVRTSF